MRRHSRLKAEETSKTKKNQTSIATRIMLALARAIEAGTVADAVAGPVAAEAEEDTVADATDEAEEDGMVVAMADMVATAGMGVRDVKVFAPEVWKPRRESRLFYCCKQSAANKCTPRNDE